MGLLYLLHKILYYIFHDNMSLQITSSINIVALPVLTKLHATFLLPNSCIKLCTYYTHWCLHALQVRHSLHEIHIALLQVISFCFQHLCLLPIFIQPVIKEEANYCISILIAAEEAQGGIWITLL